MSKIIYQTSPIVTVGNNTFQNVPVIFQYDDIPMIQVVPSVKLGYETKIPIFHPDGTQIGVANQNRLFTTAAGTKANLKYTKYVGKTVCTLDDKVLFELHQQTGDAFKTYAELFTPDGKFVKISDEANVSLFDNATQLDKFMITNCSFKDMRIGVWAKSNGTVSIGVS